MGCRGGTPLQITLLEENSMTADDLKSLIRAIPDFPKPGILFRDITTLIGHGEGFAASVEVGGGSWRPIRRREECCTLALT